MTISLIDDGNGKSHLEWTSQSVDSAKLLSLLKDAAKNAQLKGITIFWRENDPITPTDPETLTNAQLALVLDEYYKRSTLAEAREYYIIKAQQDAAALATIEADARYNGGA